MTYKPYDLVKIKKDTISSYAGYTGKLIEPSKTPNVWWVAFDEQEFPLQFNEDEFERLENEA